MTQMSGGDRSEHWQLPTHLWVPLWQFRLTMRGDWSLWNSSWTLCTPWLLLSLVPGKIQVNYGWESEYIGQLIPKPVFPRCNSPLWIFSLVSCSFQHKHKQCVLTLNSPSWAETSYFSFLLLLFTHLFYKWTKLINIAHSLT